MAMNTLEVPSQDRFIYARSALRGDYIRGLVGTACCAVPVIAAPQITYVLVIFGGLMTMFLAYSLRTYRKHRDIIVMDKNGIGRPAPRKPFLAWADLDGVVLKYYGSPRRRRDGIMTLRLSAGGDRLTLESDLEGFDAVLRRTADTALRRKLPLGMATQANLRALGLLPGDDAAVREAE